MRFLAKEDCLPWGRKVPIRKGEFIEEKIRYEGRQTLFGTGYKEKMIKPERGENDKALFESRVFEIKRHGKTSIAE